jgi:hypothetical protein
MGCCGSRGDSHGSSGGGGGSDGGSGYGQVGADRQPQPKWHGALGPVLFHASLPVLATGALPAFHGTVTCLMMLLCSAGLGLVVAEWRGEPTANLYHFDSLLVVLDRYQRRCVGLGCFGDGRDEWAGEVIIGAKDHYVHGQSTLVKSTALHDAIRSFTRVEPLDVAVLACTPIHTPHAWLLHACRPPLGGTRLAQAWSCARSLSTGVGSARTLCHSAVDTSSRQLGSLEVAS